MTELDLIGDLTEMLKHGAVLAVIVLFWAGASRLVGYGLQSYGLSATGALVSNALYTVGLLNAALYTLVVAVRAYQ